MVGLELHNHHPGIGQSTGPEVSLPAEQLNPGKKPCPLISCVTLLPCSPSQTIENLSNCPHLDTLNVSHNQLRSVDNCHSSILPALTSLDLSHNYLKDAAQLSCLEQCEAVSVLDLSHNRINDVLVVKVLAAMSNLRVLTLTGNPVLSLIPNYRKTMILECVSPH